MDFQCGYIVEPDLDMYKFPSDAAGTRRTTASTRTRCWTTLYEKQSRAQDVEERKKFVREFEKRAARRGGALHDDAAVAPHHPALEQGARLDRSRRATT